MTQRSPKYDKSTTTSRRLRSRADQSLSVQPPEIPQLRNLRSRRTATRASSNSRHISVSSQTEQEHQLVWGSSEILDPLPRGRNPNQTTYSGPPDPDTNLLLSRSVDVPPFHSPHQPALASSSLSRTSQAAQYELPTSSESGLLSTHLAPLPQNPSSGQFTLRLSAEPELLSNPSVELQDMSTLGFMVPSQYGSLDHFGSPAPLESQNYQMGQHQQYSSPRQQQQQQQQHPATSQAYAPTYPASPAPLRSQSSRSADQNVLPPYQTAQVPRSPYQQPLGSVRTSPQPMGYPPSSNNASSVLSSPPHSYSYPTLQPPSSHNISSLGSNSSSYPPPTGYPPTSYDITYGSLPATIYPSSTTPAYAYDTHGGLAPSNTAPAQGLSSSPDQRNVRVLNSRPKPQCWEHGCNGRQFSTFSNLLRHQREKSGTAAKSYCPRCGAEFTRTTARNGHMAHEKCKARRPSDTSG